MSPSPELVSGFLLTSPCLEGEVIFSIGKNIATCSGRMERALVLEGLGLPFGS